MYVYMCVFVLQQLPVSIPKLAQLSPCQSSDGKIYNGKCEPHILSPLEALHLSVYSVPISSPSLPFPPLSAHKRDEWIAVDPRSGAKLYTVSSAGVNSFCPADSNGEDAILLGKSSELSTAASRGTTGSVVAALVPVARQGGGG